MEPKFKWVTNHMPKSEDKNLQVMSLENVAKARAFHKSFPQYSVTPLANLPHKLPWSEGLLREGRELPL